LEDNIKREKTALLEQSQSIIERCLSDAKILAEYISLSIKVKGCIQSLNSLINGNDYLKTDGLKDLISLNYLITSQFIENYFIFFRDHDYIISSHAFYNMSHFYESDENSTKSHFMNFKYDDWDSGKWYREIFDKNYKGDFLKPGNVIMNNGLFIYPAVLYVKSVLPGVAIVIVINTGKMTDILKQINSSQNEYAYIMDSEGNVVANSGALNNPITEYKPHDKISSMYMGSFKSWENKKMIFTYVESELNSWQYISAFPYGNLLLKTASIRNTIIFVLFAAIILGIFISFYFAYTRSIPVLKILKILDDSEMQEGKTACSSSSECKISKKDTNKYTDDLTQVKSGVEKLIAANRLLMNNLEHQKNELKRTLLEQLFNGSINDIYYIQNMTSSIGIDFDKKSFIAAIIRVIAPKQRQFTDSIPVKQVNNNALKRILLEYFGDKPYLYNIYGDRIDILFSSDYTGDECMTEVETILNNLSGWMAKLLNCIVFCYVGNVYNQMLNIHLSIEEADILYRRFPDGLNGRNAVWYKEMMKYNAGYTYSVDEQIRLINLCKSGNKSAVVNLLKELYYDNFENNFPGASAVWQLKYDLMGTVYKIVNSVDVNENILREIEEFSIKQPVESFFEGIVRIYASICKLFDEKKKSHNRQLMQNIIKYLNINYNDYNLSLTSISEKFGLSEVYFSQFFKEQTGENYSAYIEKLRIQRACELLMNTKKTIKEISELVGYSCSQVFGRAFKRIKGISPITYRHNGNMANI